jgi:hypothetical protein
MCRVLRRAPRAAEQNGGSVKGVSLAVVAREIGEAFRTPRDAVGRGRRRLFDHRVLVCRRARSSSPQFRMAPQRPSGMRTPIHASRTC